MIRNRWYNYLIGGALVLLLTLSLTKALWPQITKLINDGSSTLYFIAINLTFIPLIISVIAVTLLYHKLKINKIHSQRIILGFSIWSILQIISLVISLLFGDKSLITTFNSDRFFIFLGLSLLLTPIQVATEEFLFRGYLISFLKSIKKGIIFPLILSAILFSLPHLGNPEVGDQKILFFLTYMSMALILGYVTLTYAGIEYAFGIHFANNFFSINILNYENSPLPSSPIFTSIGEVNPLPSLIQTIIFGIITIIIIKKIENLTAK